MSRIYSGLVMVMAWLCAAAPLWAQIPQQPGQPQAPGKLIVYGSYGAIAVLLMAVCTVAFKPSKRSHQD